MSFDLAPDVEIERLFRAASFFAEQLDKVGHQFNRVEFGVLSALITTWNAAILTNTLPELAGINKEFMLKHKDTLHHLREMASSSNGDISYKPQ